jgi:serine/threonine-protein kinase
MASRAALRAAAADPERIGGRYVVEARLGRGGMGAVYRARDDTTGKLLALKQLVWSHGDDREAAQLRFRREFHTMASLRHPRIVEVFDYGVADGVPYYTLELLDGRDLHDLGKVPWKRACEVLRDVAAALAFLHARRLLHRDLAPRNVRCTSDGRAKLIDFGVLATAGITGDVAGTPPFMAPETVHGDHSITATICTGSALAYRAHRAARVPARTIDQLETVWRNKPARAIGSRAGIPAALDELVMQLLAHDPLARPAGAAGVIDRLSAIAELPRPEREARTTHGWLQARRSSAGGARWRRSNARSRGSARPTAAAC